MPKEKIHILHSGGAFNKEPNLDLGNHPSEFQIAEAPMNNLYDDVSPDEADDGLIDHRCFYIFNTHNAETMHEVKIELDPPQCADGSTITFGSNLVDDVQCLALLTTTNASSTEAVMVSEPDTKGFVIFDTEFGAPFTVEWGGDFETFRFNLEVQLKNQPFCSACTVVGTNPYTITFTGDVGNRLVKLLRVVQNDLLCKQAATFDTVTYTDDDDFNNGPTLNDLGEVEKLGSKEIKVTTAINPEYVLPSGTLRVYNPANGLYESVAYMSFSGFIFTLVTTLTFDLPGKVGTDSDVFDDADEPEGDGTPLPVPFGTLEAPVKEHLAEISIKKTTDGSPINTIAPPIAKDTDVPDSTFGAAPIDIGVLRPQEGFFIWAKRTTAPSTGPKLADCFNLKFHAIARSSPP